MCRASSRSWLRGALLDRNNVPFQIVFLRVTSFSFNQAQGHEQKKHFRWHGDHQKCRYDGASKKNPSTSVQNLRALASKGINLEGISCSLLLRMETNSLQFLSRYFSKTRLVYIYIYIYISECVFFLLKFWWSLFEIETKYFLIHCLVVAGSISSFGDYRIYCWWDLTGSKQLSSVTVCHAEVFAGFSSHGNSIENIISLLKKEKYTSISLPLMS